jgi:predicted nucleic acid-binding protein
VIVVDASALVEALLPHRSPPTIRARLAADDVAAPDIIDLEVGSALRGLALGKKIGDPVLDRAVADLRRLPVDRYPSYRLVRRALELRSNLTPYDASYVALAEILGCPLITLDRGLAEVARRTCVVEVPARR